MLGSLQDRAPVVLVVDDAHWADSASASALLFALRRLHADRVLVLIVTRPGALDGGRLSWSRLLSDPERVQRVPLSGLDDHEISLLASSLGYESLTLAVAERLRLHTGGNPLYVRSLLGELSPEALAEQHGQLPAPHSFAATVLVRLTKVRAETQDLVAAAAVVGTHCPTMLAAAVAGLSDPSTALEEAIAADLLMVVPMAIPEQVAFPHPLVRAAVYDDLSPGRRRSLHLACANLTTGPTSLAHRVAASQGVDDALAAELESAAEADVAEGNLPAAVRHLLWASRVASTQDGRETSLLRAVGCLVLTGDVPAAESRLEEVLACADSARRSFAIAELTALAGRLPEAEALCREVLGRADFGAEPALAGSVMASLATICAILGNGDEAIAWAKRALEMPASSSAVAMTATQALAMGLMRVGRAQEAIAAFDGVAASRIDPRPHEPELLTARGNYKAWWGDLTGAAEDLSTVVRWSRAGTPNRNLTHAYAGLAEAEYGLGRWDEGITHAEVAVSLAEDLDRLWEVPFAHAVASYLHAGRGNWSIAAEHVDAAERIAQLVPLPVNRYYARMAAAGLARARGDWDGVIDALAPAAGSRARDPSPARGQPIGWLMNAEALIHTGNRDRAADVLDKVAEAIRESPNDVARVNVWRLRGSLEQGRGHAAKARAAFARGLDAARSARSSFADAELKLAYGQFLRKAGGRRAATEQLQAARELFERLGARPFLERCDAELTACGIRAHPLSGDDDYGLTAREQVVAALVASGKSNREVGAELYLSTKAIEYHLGNVFTKVGIRSRHELASRLSGTQTPS
jgi:DNA-binding CsgD family transcriptional regulator